MQCRNCGATLPDTARFCDECGAEQPKPAGAGVSIASAPLAVAPLAAASFVQARDPRAQPILQYDVAYPERLSRLLIFVKWLLIIPHAIVLWLLNFIFSFTTFIAFFAILFTARYPRGMWDFGMMVMRWQARLTAYLYLQRDEYPPFGDADYPVEYQLDYPQRLSRWKIFVKWLLVIPHFFAVWVLAIAFGFVFVIAWFAILFTGRYPRSLFDFTTGFTRWVHRVSLYLLMFTDAYPPFTMAQVPSPTSPVPGGPAAPPAF
jgi:hypothetical protein